MSGIRGKDTQPELLLRRGLHRRGLRFRLHVRTLPGKPDIVFPSRRAVIFAHGCFWHGHDCHLFKMPASRRDFWSAKIERNRELDARSEKLLSADDWRIGLVWECALKGKTRHPPEFIIDACDRWLRSSSARMELRGGSALPGK